MTTLAHYEPHHEPHDEPEDDWPYCGCNDEPDEEEQASVCKACGRMIAP